MGVAEDMLVKFIAPDSLKPAASPALKTACACSKDAVRM